MSSPRRSRTSRGGDSVSLSLLSAATKADETVVFQALSSGADINALDASGRSIIGCTIAGDRWNEVDASDASYALQTRLKILKTFLTHEKISLYALNAPQASMHGVTPLGLAAWLNISEVVKLLLEECSGLVSVDGMDALGATPLMYAARDGNVGVVQCLLTHGARPDFRDVNHCTSIQHALRHPQVLWLCESFLRRHRARETLADDNRRNLSQLNPELDQLLATVPHITCHPKLALNPSREDLEDMTNRLIASVRNTDIQQIHALLFPPAPSTSTATPARPIPYLVNYPDSDGSSPLHHCVSVEKPSMTVLDLLYRAGADMSLYAKSGHGTPLHCLARNARASMPLSIQSFVHHLVTDLRAPLPARDANMETCIHVAAEHGQSLNVLLALLECDTTGTVRELRNSRGLTALEVAKPHFRAAFGPSAEPLRSESAASVRTIKPSTTSVQSAATLAGLDFQDRLGSLGQQSRIPYEPALTELERATLPQSIVDNLRSLLRQSTADQELRNMQSFGDLIQETESMGQDLLMHMQTRVAEATEDLGGLRTRLAALDSFVNDLTTDDQAKQGARLLAIERAWDADDQSRRRTTDSDDSDRTAVSDSSVRHTQSLDKGLGLFNPNDSRDNIGVDADPFARACPEGHTFTELRPVRSMVNLGQHPIPATPTSEQTSPPKPDSPRQRKTSSPTRPEKARTGASKVKAWFKKKFTGDTSLKMPLISELDEAKAENVTETVKNVQTNPVDLSAPQAKVVFIACADIARIRQSLDTADRYIASATRYINQARRMLDLALQRHKNTLERAHLLEKFSAPSAQSSELIEFPPITIPSSPRDSQLIFPCPPTNVSPKSSVISFSSTLNEGEEDEPRALRMLLTRKIEHRTDDAFAELEKATTWLRIVREVTRPLRRRTATAPQ